MKEDSLNYISSEIYNYLEENITKYYELFQVEKYKPLQINLFDDREKFRTFIYILRDGKSKPPKYAVGTYDKGMINAFIQNNIQVGSPLYKVKLCLPMHELFHIMYMDLILKNESLNRIV